MGVAVVAHAMMSRRSEFDRPEGKGIARWLVECGWRVVAFDFRGHGDSGPGAHQGASFSYDDLVVHDAPSVVEFARARAPRRKPVVLVGHSLGGHVALAAQGAGLVKLDAIAAVGVNLWLREDEPSLARWIAKRAIVEAMLRVCRRVGRFPARALRMGSDDEPLAYLEAFTRFTRTGRWTSDDGRVDYLASLANVRVPVLTMVSDGDRLSCVPECGARFVARCSGPRELVRVTRADDGGAAPDHMGIVTSGRIASAWERAEAWLRASTCG